MPDLHLIKNCITEIPDVVAAYLFGSSAGDDQAVNDLDILVFLNEKAKRLETKFVLSEILLRIPRKQILPGPKKIWK